MLADLGSTQDPWRQVVLGWIHVLGASFDWMLVLVASHTGNIEEHASQSVGETSFDRTEAGHEFTVTTASEMVNKKD